MGTIKCSAPVHDSALSSSEGNRGSENMFKLTGRIKSTCFPLTSELGNPHGPGAVLGLEMLGWVELTQWFLLQGLGRESGVRFSMPE